MLKLEATKCAICRTFGNVREVWPQRLGSEAFTPEVFSARRLPDRLHYRMVRCNRCGLVRSDPVLTSDSMRALYEAASFDYGDELPSLARTYAQAVQQVSERCPSRRLIVDVGCGNGFVLEQALRQGWENVGGVEPTGDALRFAHPSVKPFIKQTMMSENLFPPQSVTLFTLFQVLDHISDPLNILRACRKALEPGGYILAWNHNVESLSSRILQERSPIVDVEHTFLYDRHSMRLLFEKAGFEVVDVSPVTNLYSLRYLAHLAPLPHSIKTSLTEGAPSRLLGKTRVRVPLGNLCLVAQA